VTQIGGLYGALKRCREEQSHWIQTEFIC
jgi:hypothetical protein